MGSRAEIFAAVLICLSITLVASGWLLMRTRRSRVGCAMLYAGLASTVSSAVASGVVLLAVAWLGPRLLPERKETFDDRAVAASIAIASAALTFAGKKMIAVREQVHACVRWLFRRAFRRDVPSSLPIGRQEREILAFKAVYDDDFVVPSVTAIRGWGIKACGDRAAVIDRYVSGHARRRPRRKERR